MNALAGTIYLVGAGPGDPSLVTVRGAELLAAADVVVYDRLAAPELLSTVRADAELIDVGKCPGDHTMPQERINQELVRHALAGHVVVRLKGGDPFIFGRGFEELQAAREAGVPCEVVPGVSSAVAVPASAGIPATCRGVARTFAVATPQTGTGMPLGERDYAALAGIDTVSFLMPLSELRTLAAGLQRAGRNADTPAALIERGTTPRQKQVLATLGTIADAAVKATICSPAVLVVGSVAALASDSAVAGGPLAGQSIVVTRPRTASGELTRRLRALGASVIDAPLIRIEYRDPPDTSWKRGPWGWVVFCSLHGVRGFWRALRREGLDARWLAGAKIAAVGPKTAAELRRCGLEPDLVPDEHRAAALARLFNDPGSGPSTLLFPCGTLAREELPEALRARGYSPHPMLVYNTLPARLDDDTLASLRTKVSAVLLYSPSAAQSLAACPVDLGGAQVVCLGPTTAEAARRAGFANIAVPGVYGDDGVIGLLLQTIPPARSLAHGV
ncbi:MAG: uroporphyrinogen-III C-methyltransferase [bacterium]